MAERKLEDAEQPELKGDPDFAEVARERLGGPADYDESAGNELQQPAQPAREDAEQTRDEDRA